MNIFFHFLARAEINSTIQDTVLFAICANCQTEFDNNNKKKSNSLFFFSSFVLLGLMVNIVCLHTCNTHNRARTPLHAFSRREYTHCHIAIHIAHSTTWRDTQTGIRKHSHRITKRSSTVVRSFVRLSLTTRSLSLQQNVFSFSFSSFCQIFNIFFVWLTFAVALSVTPIRFARTRNKKLYVFLFDFLPFLANVFFPFCLS